MIAIELKQRILTNKDWITALFMLCFLLIGVTKNAYATRFKEYSNLLFSDKYIKIYKDNSNLKSWFTIVLFGIQILSLSFFINFVLSFFYKYPINDFALYVRILTVLTFFILSKFLLEKIVATLFNIEEFIEQFNLYKISYRSFVSFLLLPILLILFYNHISSKTIVYIIISILLLSNILIYLNGLKTFQKPIFGNLFYFILYLCTFEIAPYYFAYYFFAKN